MNNYKDLPREETFNNTEKEEYFWALDKLRKIFRNGPIYGTAVQLLVDEIVDKRKTGYPPVGDK